jgi:hypothetical protein
MRRPWRFTPILIAVGLLFLTGSTASLLISPRVPTPGNLRARIPQLVWRCPEGEKARPPFAGEAGATFQIENHGGQPVRILNVEKSCGCLDTQVQPQVIPPGGSATVVVHATPILVGQRTETVSLQTDSPLTPTVTLALKIVGSRRPPFLLRAEGAPTRPWKSASFSPLKARAASRSSFGPDRAGPAPRVSISSPSAQSPVAWNVWWSPF